ncbi:hypothetical protein [Halapricum hydrolyticum]|uniref:Zinc finger PHD-type domain-containing protein n=1 Tax=Halapricum hydrolyticum TaxID=2979991 RepID=A0AAE3I9J3_9EURY|nr:hypothetical protein [Halapricum hydrolyticum]MCU4718238.1 hypothetical protein [Halapricum hydrolyticum]MCU4726321.1 hypothetical protein [Halapricum hydrolyticum]
MDREDDCTLCGEGQIDDSCSRCGVRYHVACARASGNLEVTRERGGVLTSSTVYYDWTCPECGWSISVKAPAI